MFFLIREEALESDDVATTLPVANDSDDNTRNNEHSVFFHRVSSHDSMFAQFLYLRSTEAGSEHNKVAYTLSALRRGFLDRQC